MNYTVAQLTLAVATGLGSFGGFPAPPAFVRDLMKNEMISWALLFVLIWQGGAGQDSQLALLVTAAFYAASKAL